MRVRVLTLDDLETCVAHLVRQIGETGRDGLPISSPYPPSEPPDADRFRSRRKRGWALHIGAPEWMRTWGAWDGPRLIGHVEIHGGRLASELHRVTLGLGVERAYHRRGVATALMREVIDWARAAPTIDWIDLGVFSTNTAAQALYDKLGFTRIGVRTDRFRIEGASIDDIEMVLRVSEPPPNSQNNN